MRGLAAELPVCFAQIPSPALRATSAVQEHKCRERMEAQERLPEERCSRAEEKIRG
jgi:hypothetical protein